MARQHDGMGVDVLEIVEAEDGAGAAATRLAHDRLDLVLRIDLDGHALGLEGVGDLLRGVVGAEDGELLRVEVPDALWRPSSACRRAAAIALPAKRSTIFLASSK